MQHEMLTPPETTLCHTRRASPAPRWQDRPKPQLHARAYLRLGLYQWHIHDAGLDAATIQRCLGLLKVRPARPPSVGGLSRRLGARGS